MNYISYVFINVFDPLKSENGPGGNLTPALGSGDRHSDIKLQTLKIIRNT